MNIQPTPNKPFSVLLFLNEYSIYEFVTAPDPAAAIQAALKLHDWPSDEPYSVELVLNGHHTPAI